MGKILAFSGSNSSKSINQKLINYVASLIKHNQIEVINLRDFEAPLYGIDLENESGIPPKMIELNDKFNSVDGFIISTPEHNGSMPAVLKNTIDWISRIGDEKVFKNKPTVFLSTSPGARGAQSALNHLVDIMPHRGAVIIGSNSLGNFNENYIDGKIVGEKNIELTRLIGKLEEAI